MLFHSKFLLVCGVIMLQTSTAFAQEQPKAKSTMPNWIVACNNRTTPEKLSCNMSSTLWSTKIRQKVASVRIRPIGDQYGMRLTLPHGIDFPAGVTIKVDDKDARKFPVTTADSDGAYSRVIVSPEFLAEMRAGNTMALQVKSIEGRTINLEITLKGFSASLALMK